MRHEKLPAVVVITLSLVSVDCRAAEAMAKKDLSGLVSFAKGYSLHKHPPALRVGEPLEIFFQLNLRNVLQVDEVSQHCSLETTIRMYWYDKRIKPQMPAADHNTSTKDNRDYVTLNPKAAKHFWIPDVFIDQAKDLRVPVYHTRPASLRVYGDSKIRFAARVNFDVACPMLFHRYPHDVQLCEIKFESFGFTSRQMKYVWMAGNHVNANISLPQFLLEVEFGDEYATDYYDLAYPGVIFRLILRRKMSFHLIQTYLPSCIFVLLSWLTMFISHDQVAGRVTMTMTTLLTLTAMFGSVRTSVPKVSYVSFLDVWMFMCMLFVFVIILHFVAILILLGRGLKAAAHVVDVVGTAAIPTFYAAFNLMYWMTLLHE